MSYVIGVSAYYHDSSVALFKDGRLVDFVKEEWLSRVKGDKQFPARSLMHLKSRWSLCSDNVSQVIFYERPFRAWMSLVSWSAEAPVARWRLGQSRLLNFFNSSVFFEAELKRVLPGVDTSYADHHRSHAANAKAYALFPEKCRILVLDSFGQGCCGGVFESDLHNISEFEFPNSVGIFYSAITDYLGFEINEGESKMMGLAAFGKPVFIDCLRKMIFVSSGKPEIDLQYFDFQNTPNRHFSKRGKNLLPHFEGAPLDENNFSTAANLAASAQALLEEVLLELIKVNIGDCKEILISGGIALNVSAVSTIARELPDITVTVPISPGDSGSAIGAAMLDQGNRPPNNSMSLFPAQRSTNFEAEKFAGLIRKIKDSKDSIPGASRLIIAGQPVALLGNSMELGPRALGSTSIIFHSTRRDARKIFNDRVKGRETYRPLAPVVLERYYLDYFEDLPNAYHLLRYMGAVVPQTDLLKVKYPGYAHVDGSCRVQVVDEEAKLLHAVLTELEQHDVHVLINTSFNVGGDPMVYDELDAIVSLKRMGLRYLLTEDGLYEMAK